jgi:hypothetical protein
MTRWIGFLIAIVIGAAGGLLYGWVLDPVEYVNTTPGSLRIDYQSDYVLMVAEIYHTQKSLPSAINQLQWLGKSTPLEYVEQALKFGEQQGYSEKDLLTLSDLHNALLSWNPMLGTLVP